MALKLITRPVITVTTAGTAVPISTTEEHVHSISIQAQSDNSGVLYVGDSSVASTTGQELGAGEVYVINAFDKPYNLEELDLQDIYIDAATNGDVARIAVVKKRTNA